MLSEADLRINPTVYEWTGRTITLLIYFRWYLTLPRSGCLLPPIVAIPYVSFA